MTRIEQERQILIESGFAQDLNLLSWSMATSTGKAFVVTERDLREHVKSGNRLPVRWMEAE